MTTTNRGWNLKDYGGTVHPLPSPQGADRCPGCGGKFSGIKLKDPLDADRVLCWGCWDELTTELSLMDDEPDADRDGFPR